jgi:hypothetical protein
MIISYINLTISFFIVFGLAALYSKIKEIHNEILNIRNRLHYLEHTHENHFEDLKSYYSKRNID